MIDLKALAERRSLTMKTLEDRLHEVRQLIVREGRVYSIRSRGQEDVALVSLQALIELAKERDDLLRMVEALERQLAIQSGIPMLGGP